jgi:hypothetical protein
MTKALNGSEIITGYLPKINNQPPEYAYPASWDSDYPVMVRNNYGKGESIYFANEMEKLNYTVGHPDYDQLLTNSINHLLGQQQVLKTSAPASVHIYLNQSNKSTKTYQLSLVNTSSSSQRPFRDLIPVEKITVELPFNIESAEILYGDDNNKVKFSNNQIIIDHLEEFYSIRINSR